MGSAENATGFEFELSDGELEESLQEAIEASIDEYWFRTQLEETLNLSNAMYANDLQLGNIDFSSPVSNPSPSKDGASSSVLKEEKEYMSVKYYEEEHGLEFPGYGGENMGSSSGEVDTGSEWRQCGVEKAVPLELCGICYEDSAAKLFEGIRCLHRFCHPCITKYIQTRLEEKRHQIYCPHDSCDESITPQNCQYFLPVEIVDAWSAIILEAEIPESEKVYCPFPDCSAMLVNEDVADLYTAEILNAECPSCNRMFCVKCMVPWHADLDCEEFQRLPRAERSEEDRELFKLAEAQNWQRCSKCGCMIEMEYGCNHMTCRCGYEFCYECGSGWSNGRPSCDCPRANENRLLLQPR